MDAPLLLAAVAGLAVLAGVLCVFPRALLTEAAGDVRPSPRGQVLFGAGLFLVGLLAMAAAPLDPPGRLVFAGVCMTLAAVVYTDLRHLVIPDLYSALVALAAFVGPLSPGLIEAGLGALACGGLLMLIAFVWKRRTAVEGLGFGDVKLAAALGALLGAEHGLWAITVSAAGGAVLGLVLQAMRRDRDGPLLFPYGVPLALAGAGFLIWRLR
jgi:leader peptidase (prepilin peptidase)/N-methyltransferase